MPRADDAAMPPAGETMPEEGESQGPDTEPAMEAPSEDMPGESDTEAMPRESMAPTPESPPADATDQTPEMSEVVRFC